MKVERQQSTDLRKLFKKREKERKKKEGDRAPDSEPKLSEVAIPVREEWGGARGGAVQGGRPSDRAE